MKIKGLKKAIGDYKRFNSEGAYSPRYGILMFNKGTGEIWTNEYYDIGHGSYTQYEDENIVNLSRIMKNYEVEINMQNVKEFIENEFERI